MNFYPRSTGMFETWGTPSAPMSFHVWCTCLMTPPIQPGFRYHLTVLSDFKSCCAIQISQLLLFIVIKANFARFYFSQLDPTCFLRLWTSGKGFHEPFILKISIAVLITYQVIKVLIHKEEFSSCSIQRVKEIHFSY